MQAIRGLAAIAVVLYHLNAWVLPHRLHLPGLWSGFDMGYAGVEVFFVLSGFLMARVHGRDIGRPDRLGPFVAKRAVRILPFFWVVLAGEILLDLLATGQVPSARSILSSALLWPAFDRQIIVVAWSLSFEVMFYAGFAVAILSRPVGLALAGAWCAACLATLPSGRAGVEAVWLSPYNLLFAMGILAALPRPGPRGALVCVIVGGVLFLATGLSEAVWQVDWPKSLRTLSFGIGAAALILGVTALETGGARPGRAPLSLVGDASYAIYLLHMPALALMIRLVPAGHLPLPLTFGLLFCGALLAGIAGHLLIERPVLAWCRGRLAAGGHGVGSGPGSVSRHHARMKVKV